MASQKSIQEKAFRLAGAVPKYAVEDLFRTALRQATIEQQYRRSFSLTIASGSVVLPDGVIVEQMKSAHIDAGSVPTSYEERYSEYSTAPRRQLNFATVRNKEFLFRAAGGNAGAYNGAITLTAVAMPDVPAAITDTITMPETLADRTAEILAEMLRPK